jgi:hypothetical protein
MANGLYDKGRNKFLRGEISWNNDVIDVALVNLNVAEGGYHPDLANDEFLSDIPETARVAVLSDNVQRETELIHKTTENGVADAANAVFEEVEGALIGAIIIFKRGAADGDSPLIAFKDTALVLPVEPDGRDITISWNKGPNKIFKL